MLPVYSPASSSVTRASSPGKHERVAGRLSGKLDRATDRLAWRARPILHGPFRTRSHPITMHLWVRGYDTIVPSKKHRRKCSGSWEGYVSRTVSYSS
ncbi:hypothetical protein DY000_02053399 [Brassica cretica]|uniref:Uncharacterized protein n=1 Tax=Brassica cretica TaxID=69181 RepID=A0ABQ7AKB7_BRACR|nr:hypothetical protein DY000_02053399 [Brassica cretica]